MAFLTVFLELPMCYHNSQTFFAVFLLNYAIFNKFFLRVSIDFHHICTVLATIVKNMMSLVVLFGIDKVVPYFPTVSQDFPRGILAELGYFKLIFGGF